jgi:hypothetical protein
VGVPNLRHLEYFHDHQRIERMFFDGTLDPEGGVLTPEPGRPGWGWNCGPRTPSPTARAEDRGLARAGGNTLRSHVYLLGWGHPRVVLIPAGF